MALTDKLVAIGDAIRSSTGTSSKMTLDEMAQSISGMSQVKVFAGSFTYDTDTPVNGTVIAHEAGFVPQLIIVTLMSETNTGLAFQGGFYAKEGVFPGGGAAELFVKNANLSDWGNVITQAYLEYSGIFEDWSGTGFRLYTNMSEEICYGAGLEYNYFIIGGIPTE